MNIDHQQFIVLQNPLDVYHVEDVFIDNIFLRPIDAATLFTFDHPIFSATPVQSTLKFDWIL